MRVFFITIECIVSELSGKMAIIGRANTLHNSPIQDMRSGRHSSSVPSPRTHMDAKTPCIAEAARRLLRTDGTSLIVPEDLFDEALQLSLAISDGIPSLIREPTVSIGPSDRIEVEGLSLIGGEEPSTIICWIPTTADNLHSLWQRWTVQIHDLMTAGYPGCVGCGGPGSEGIWDETASRARTRVN